MAGRGQAVLHRHKGEPSEEPDRSASWKDRKKKYVERATGGHWRINRNRLPGRREDLKIELFQLYKDIVIN